MSKSAHSILLDPGFSRTLYAYLVTIHVAALGAVLLCPWPFWIRCGGLAAVAAAAVLIHHSLQEAEVGSLGMMTDGSWRLRLRGGVECKAELCGESLVTPAFCLLVFACADRRRRVLVVRDSLGQESYRRLRVALRVYGRAG